MVLHEFPDLNWLKRQAESRFSDRRAVGGNLLPQGGWPSVILNTKASNIYRDNIRGPFSIFTNINGTSMVTTDNHRVVVRDKFFYVSNHDQHYTLEVGRNQKAETFNIHFGESFATDLLSSFSKSSIQLLDSNEFTAESFALHNRLYRRTERIELLIGTLQHINDNNLLEEECLTALMIEILKEDHQSKKLIERIDSIRKSTRAEILKRLTVVVDYIYSSYDRDVSLDELANMACLSKFHFLRLFKIAFQSTPHQFITEVRMMRAKEMLLDKKNGVKEIGRMTGFKDSSSFSRKFHSYYGVYPTQFA